jgi:hypothetical protein
MSSVEIKNLSNKRSVVGLFFQLNCLVKFNLEPVSVRPEEIVFFIYITRKYLDIKLDSDRSDEIKD